MVEERKQADHGANIYSAFEQAARRYPEQVALKADGGRGRSYTYRDVVTAVGKLSKVLFHDKFAASREIGLLSENRPEWGIAYLGILAAGRTVVPIDANLKSEEIAFIIRDARLRLVFASRRSEALLSEMNIDIDIISLEEDSPHSWRNLSETPAPPAEYAINETAVLIYTSGTTGAPKAVELTHRNILANMEGIAGSLQFDENDTFLSVLPLHHTFESTCGFLTPLFSGCTIVYARSLKSKELLEDLRFNGATLMCGVPLLFEKMYGSLRRKIASASFGKRVLFHTLYTLSSLGWLFGRRWGKALFHGLRDKAGLGSIRMFVSGSAALPPVIARFYHLLGCDLVQGYGMTECSPVISVVRPDDIQFGSVGPPLNNVEVKIAGADPETGVGEIIVKGDSITPGYRNNAEQTAELIVDGWLHTGDLGKLEHNHLWITGRKKNLIVSAAGKNIYPEELEEKLMESDCILEAVVFGRPKQNRQGEQVCALLVPDMEQIATILSEPSDRADQEKIRQLLSAEIEQVNGRIAGYKRIVSFDFQLEELEKTSTKKVKRFLYK
ncbi:MAG: AMP-binding protein [bacterium]